MVDTLTSSETPPGRCMISRCLPPSGYVLCPTCRQHQRPASCPPHHTQGRPARRRQSTSPTPQALNNHP
eukprot:2287794-Rhodomonas_salina.1